MTGKGNYYLVALQVVGYVRSAENLQNFGSRLRKAATYISSKRTHHSCSQGKHVIRLYLWSEVRAFCTSSQWKTMS